MARLSVKSSCRASIKTHALRTPHRFRSTSQIVSVSVIKASPANFKLSIDRLAASSLPAPQASVTSTGVSARSAPWRTVGSIPISVATPTMIKALMPQSRKAKSSHLPSKADNSQFVEDAFSRMRLQFRQDLKSRSVAQKPWIHLFRRIRALPGHRHAELKHPH